MQAPNGEDTIEVIYTVEQTDVDNYDRIKNVATATVPDGPSDNGEDENVPTDKTATIDVVKTATKINGNNIKEGDKVKAGDKITYTITVKNTGYVTLKNIVVTDELEVSYDENKDGVGDTTVAPEATIKTIASLVPDEEDTIEVIYTVTQTDVDTYETIRNVATATVPDGPSDEDDETTPTDNTPSIDVVKTAEEIKAVGSSEFVELNRDAQGNITSYVENVGDIIRYTITATNNGAKVLENVNVIDQNHNVKVLKITKGTNVYEQTGKEDDITAGTNLLNFLPDVENRTLEPGESYVIEVEYTVENVNNISAIENTAVATGMPRNEQTPVSDNDDEYIPVAQNKSSDITKTAIKVNGNTIENRDEIKLKKGDTVTYEIVVSNDGNTDLTDVTVTDDHNVTVTKIEKVNADGTRTEDRELKNNATAANLLGKTTLGAGETYVITVTYKVEDDFINEEETNGDKIINIATLNGKFGDENFSDSDDDELTKNKEAIITQEKTSRVEGNSEGDNTVQKGSIIEYTITVKNTGNISGGTTVTDEMLKQNIDNNKITMLNTNGTELSKEASYETNCINVTVYKADGTTTTTTTNVNTLAAGLPMSVDNGERVVITFKVKVGNLLPGETINNVLKGHETEHVENDVEAKIQVNKKLIRPQETVIVIDLSRSMAEAVDFVKVEGGPEDPFADTYTETRWYALKTALDSFLNTYMKGANNENEVTIIGYNGTASTICKTTTSLSEAKSSYANVLTEAQFNSGRRENPNDVDALENTDSKLLPGTNIEDGLYQARRVLSTQGNTLNGAKVILMTDGEANKRGTNGNSDSCSATEGINAAKTHADYMKNRGTIIYTVSLSLGSGNQGYIDDLNSLASGEEYAKNSNNMEELIEDFKEISEIISEQEISTTTRKGIVYLSDEFRVDGDYVQNVVITIPDQDGNNQTFTLSWSEFNKYYSESLKTINITELAKDKEIQGITGAITIDINVDTVVQQ